jgi:hypothetical protein
MLFHACAFHGWNGRDMPHRARPAIIVCRPLSSLPASGCFIARIDSRCCSLLSHPAAYPPISRTCSGRRRGLFLLLAESSRPYGPGQARVFAPLIGARERMSGLGDALGTRIDTFAPYVPRRSARSRRRASHRKGPGSHPTTSRPRRPLSARPITRVFHHMLAECAVAARRSWILPYPCGRRRRMCKPKPQNSDRERLRRCIVLDLTSIFCLPARARARRGQNCRDVHNRTCAYRDRALCSLPSRALPDMSQSAHIYTSPPFTRWSRSFPALGQARFPRSRPKTHTYLRPLENQRTG